MDGTLVVPTRPTLLVEFEVEKEVKKDYGYVEKYLMYRGQKIPYKAIVKNGKLLAIVSRRYQLIENERVVEICSEIAKRLGLSISVQDYEVSVHVFLDDAEREIGVVVHNSVDGSLALKIDATVNLGASKTIFRINTEQVYNKHYKSALNVLRDLDGIITTVLEKAEDFKYFIDELAKMSAKDYHEDLQVLEELLPKRYVEDVLRSVQYNLYRIPPSLKTVYERIANRIWSSNINMKTKISYFDKLNQFMFALAGWKE